MGAPRFAMLSLTALVLASGCESIPPAPDDEAVRRPVRIPQPIAPADEGVSANLLQAYAARKPVEQREADAWELPFQSKRLVVALLTIAAHDRLGDLDMVLTADATWGLPETRRFGARPIFGADGGEAFLAALRTAATRFPDKAKWQTQPLLPGPQDIIRAGAEPLWSFYSNGNDRIYFREVIHRGHARIDYVGLFEEVPTEPVRVIGHGRPVPLGPQVRRGPAADATEVDAETLERMTQVRELEAD